MKTKKERSTYIIRNIFFDNRPSRMRYYVQYDIEHEGKIHWKGAYLGKEEWTKDEVQAMIGFADHCRKSKNYKIRLVDGRDVA